MTTTDLIPAPQPGDILLPADVELVRQAMTAYQEVTRAVLDQSDWQGPAGADGSFVKKSGWQKIAKAYRLSTEVVRETVDRDPDGHLLRAGAVIRAIAPNGQHREATGYCDRNEPRFAREAGRQKIENDMRNTAATRAENRAISNLTGLGTVSAEEVGQPAPEEGHAHGAGGGLPAWALPAGDVAQVAETLGRIIQAMGGDPAQVAAIGNAVFESCNAIPACVADTLDLIAETIPEQLPLADVEVEAQ